MKKKNPTGPLAAFNNNPFKSLKSIKPTLEPSAPGKPSPGRKEKKEEDAAGLFMRAVSGVRALHADEPGEMPELKKNKVLDGESDDDRDQHLFLQAMQSIGTTLSKPQSEDEFGEETRQSASSRMKQLKRGTIRIGEELDLHGHPRNEALLKLEPFVSAAYRRGRKAVLVITGKGINSPDGPVLPGAVADWLRGKGKGMVAEFAPAPRDRGGSGAFVVFLKNPRRS
jgi:DNA-nicking Smr family endonuclease